MRAWPLSTRPSNVRAWDAVPPERKDQWDMEMSIYAAQVEEMDQGIGRVLAALPEKSGREDNTLVMFLSDNGGAAEDPNRSLPGAVPGHARKLRRLRPGGGSREQRAFPKNQAVHPRGRHFGAVDCSVAQRRCESQPW